MTKSVVDSRLSTYDKEFTRHCLNTKKPEQIYREPTEGLRKSHPFVCRLEQLKMLERQTIFAEKRGGIGSGYQRKRASQPKPVVDSRKRSTLSERLKEQVEFDRQNTLLIKKEKVQRGEENTLRTEKKSKLGTKRESYKDFNKVILMKKQPQSQSKQQQQQQQTLFHKAPIIIDKKLLRVKGTELTDFPTRRLVHSANVSNNRDKIIRNMNHRGKISSQLSKRQSSLKDILLPPGKACRSKQEETNITELRLGPINETKQSSSKKMTTHQQPAEQIKTLEFSMESKNQDQLKTSESQPLKKYYMRFVVNSEQ